MKKQAVYGVIFSEKKDQVLLVKRRDLPVWVLPGGGLDTGETPLEGVKREVEEEIGCPVQVKRQIATYLPVNNLTQTTYFFECSLEGSLAIATEESESIQFFPLQKLPKRLAPPFALWIADALEKTQSPVEKKTEGVTYPILVKLLFLHPILITRYLLTKIGIRFQKKQKPWRPAKSIRFKVIGIAINKNKILVCEVLQDDGAVKGWCPLGGGVLFGENAKNALAREIEEELHSKITISSSPIFFENIFTHQGVQGHEIILAFAIRFEKNEIYTTTRFQISESRGSTHFVEWIELDRFYSGKEKLFPPELIHTIKNWHGV